MYNMKIVSLLFCHTCQISVDVMVSPNIVAFLGFSSSPLDLSAAKVKIYSGVSHKSCF